MTKVEKVFEFILPLKKCEYNIGNRYATIQKYRTDKSQGYKITLIKKESTEHDTFGKVETTTKHLHLHSKIPGIVKKCIPDAACILTEVSYYNERLIHTSYKNNHFSHDVFNIKIETHFTNESPFPGVNVENIDLSNGEESIKIYKRMNIEVNNWMMGWIANEISKNMKNQLLEHHKAIVETKNVWVNMDIKELNKMEDELFN